VVKNDPIRLTGTDDEIVAVARRAWRLVASDQRTRGILPALDQLGRQRHAFMAEFSRPTVVASPPAPSSASPGRPILWSVLLGLALLAATVSAALAGPVLKRVTLEPDAAIPVVLAAILAAVVLLAVTAVGWLRRRHRSAQALTLVVVVLLIVVAVAVYRLVIGPVGGTTDFTAGQLGWWFFGAVVAILELGLLALLVRPLGDGQERDPGAQTRARGRRLRADAAGLAGQDVPSEVTQAWETDLDAIAGVPDATREQARRLGPVAWLAWTFYDGELDVTAVPRP
jgi:hypothetical protein